MNALKNILYKVTLEAVVGDTSVLINAIQFDSRKIESNDAFVAIKGQVVDGHNYIDVAIKNGAVVIIVEQLPDALESGITYVQVHNSNSALAVMASNYYNSPSENLKLVGVTGTNGKTTIASLLYSLFKKAGYKVGLLSTVKIMVDEIEYEQFHFAIFYPLLHLENK